MPAFSRPVAVIRCAPGRAVLHSLPIGYSLDEATGIRDPRGMLGHRFGIDMHIATADVAVARNLMLAIERCHIDVEAMAAGPYAAGLSVLTDDETDLGAALIDMGAGTTTMAVFAGGRFVHADGFALGRPFLDTTLIHVDAAVDAILHL